MSVRSMYTYIDKGLFTARNIDLKRQAKVENYKELGLNSETAVMFNITSKEQVIVNTWYGGEMKKGMFSMMNYFLPLKGMASMHCSSNTDLNGENTAIFFGLSGTGKTTHS